MTNAILCLLLSSVQYLIITLHLMVLTDSNERNRSYADQTSRRSESVKRAEIPITIKCQLEKLLQLCMKANGQIFQYTAACARFGLQGFMLQLQHRSRENISTHSIIVLNLEPTHKLKEYFPFTRQLIFFVEPWVLDPSRTQMFSEKERESV